MGIDAEMFVRVRRAVPDAEVKRLRYRMAEAFGASRFWIFNEAGKAAPVERDEDASFDNRHCMERVKVYTQDGPDILPEPGETFLRVYPATRYYGDGYERGDLPLLISLAEWLEANTGGEVWYGGDSGGCCAKVFDHDARAQLFAHFCRHGHQPYRSGWDALTAADDTKVTGLLCTFCDFAMTRNGWGPNYQGWDCYGCGMRMESRDNGATFTKAKEAA